MSADEAVRVMLDVSAVPDRPVGAGHYILQLARALDIRDDVDLVLCSRKDDRARWEMEAPRAEVRGAVPGPRPLRLAWERFRLAAVLQNMKAEVHHGPHYTMPASSPVPSVVTIHDLSFFDEPGWHERSKVVLFRRAIATAATRAAVVVCPSATTADALHRWCDVRADVVVAPHGVDTDRFSPDEPLAGADAERLARLDARLEPGRPLVVFVGTLEPRKDVPTLVRAFDDVANRHPDAVLVLAGGRGWAGDAVERAVAATSVQDRIVRTGYVEDDDIPALLRSAAAVAYPSLYEGFGLPALEALAVGAPLVTTSGTAMEEVAGSSALLVAPGDRESLSDALDLLLGGDDGPGVAERRALGLEIAARHTWESSAASHAKAYRTAVQSRRGA